MSPSPVVLVHGNSESGAHWHVVAQRLRAAGHDQVFAIDFDPPAHGSCVTYATQLRAFVDGPVTDAVGPTTPLAFVAHSLGVTSLRHYLTHLGGVARLARAILIAGCNHGVPVCDTMLLADPDAKIFHQAPELRTDGSSFLAALAAHEDTTRLVTISGPHDHSFALWEDSPQLPGADNRVLPGLGHWGLRDSDQAWVLIKAFLGGETAGFDLGTTPLALPTDPTGEWLAGEPDTEARALHLGVGGLAVIDLGSSHVEGRWTSTRAGRVHHLDIESGAGRWQGAYRMTVDGQALGLALAGPAQPRPDSLTLAPLFHRALSRSGRPGELVGRWKADHAGTLAPLGVVAPLLHLGADGAWSLAEGETAIADGVWQATASEEPESYLLDLDVAHSTSFMLRRGACWGALARRVSDRLEAEFAGGTYRTCRPFVIDFPTVFTPG